MPQLLDVAFGVFNTGDQDQEKERTQQEKRQASVHAQLITVAVNHALQPQDNPRGPIKSTYPSGGKANKGECFTTNARQLAPGPEIAMPSLQNKQVTGDLFVLCLEGEVGCPLWRCPC